MKQAIRIWKQTLETLPKNAIIFLPFVIVALFDVTSLILIYLAPQPPLSTILAPPIRAFWGEKFLHYPSNLILLPKLFSYAHIITISIIGVLMTGLAIGMLNQAKGGTRPQILLNFIQALKRYFALLAIWLVMFIPAFFIYRIPRYFVALNHRAVIHIVFYTSFFVVALIQVIFVYAFPAVIIERKGIISAIKRGVLFSKNNLLATLMLVVIPALFYIPVILLRGNLTALMSRFSPEIVLIVAGLGIVVSMLIDCIVTCSTTILFLNQRKDDYTD